MDLNPEITFPICTAIIMAGLAWLTYIRSNRKNPTENTMMKDLKRKLAEVFLKKEDCIKKEVLLSLERGEKDFKKVKSDLESQGKMLARIDERSLMWAQHNGYGKPKIKED